MGEAYSVPAPLFNTSIRVEARPERLSSDGGALLLREYAERTGILDWLAANLMDDRDPDLITHSERELVASSLLLMAQGWRDQDDADALRHDPILRLAVSSRRGVSPLLPPPKPKPGELRGTPDGLASQPTMSRMFRRRSSDHDRTVSRKALMVQAGRRVRAMKGGTCDMVGLDIDSLPVTVEGHQEGSAYNAHYHERIYHPIVASLGELGDIVDVRLRPGNAHTAEGALDFVLPLVAALEQHVCELAFVRMDAGFPADPLLGGLEERQAPYVARVRNNARLDTMAGPILAIPEVAGLAPGDEAFVEFRYKADSWSRERRVVLVVVRRDGELIPNYFWLITNWTPEQMAPSALLDLYRKRGCAEALMGEWMNVIAPALSSARRQKAHYRGAEPEERTESGEPFAINEAILLFSAMAYNLAHGLRLLAAEETGEGWSLQRLRDRVLKTAARVVVHARRATVVIAASSAPIWSKLWNRLARLHPIQATSTA